jgi:glycosyltransferase involved in cell wall biosynthesis
MKIIHTVCVYNPQLSGNQQIMQQLSERLVKRGHEVTIFTTYDSRRNFDELNGVKIKQFRVWGTKAVGIKGEVDKYKRYLLNSDYDIIMNYGSNVWTSDLTFDVLDKIKSAKVFVPVGHTPLASPFWRFVYRNYYKNIVRYMNLYNKIIYVSEKPGIVDDYVDKNFGDIHGITNYSIIPNAIAVDEFEKNQIDFKEKYDIKTKYMLLTVGYHQKLKGHKFIINSFKKLSREDTTLVLIGYNVRSRLPIHSCHGSCIREAKKSCGRILVLDNIPRKDTVAAFLASDIYLLGSKFECSPIVILEAMATKTCFISTNVGNVNEMPGGIIIKNEIEMAQYIEKLLNDPIQRGELAELGYASCMERFDWERITNMYENLYKQLID